MCWDEREDVEKVQSQDSDAKKLSRSVFEARSREAHVSHDPSPSSVSRIHILIEEL